MMAQKKTKESSSSKDKSGFSSKPESLKPPGISSKNRKNNKQTNTGIPKPVANRMARRVALTTGLPTLSGMGIFIASYLLVSKGIADIPPGVTLLSSAGCFLLGLVGLSYGILSASWDKEPGSFLGIENIGQNIKRVRLAFGSNKDSLK